MKKFKTLIALILCMGLLISSTSCSVHFAKDNGKHKGWYKNSNNPHHVNTTNPGKSKGSKK
jgi:ABC-type oligopeptide transport system substrate-binding subunit